MVVRCILISWGRWGEGGNGQENISRHVCFFTCHPCIIGIPKINESKLFFCSVLLDLLAASVGFPERRLLLSQQTIESMELKRCQSASIGYEKHPRAGTPDDVEGFVALFHRFLGMIFTVKELKALLP